VSQPPFSKPSHILVTGGAGFIGSHTVELLLARGCKVSVLDNLSTGSRANLSFCDGHPDFLFLEGDITQDLAVACEPAVKRFGPIERIVHLAAQTSVILSVEDPVTAVHINLGGTARLLEYARRNGVTKIAFASSAAVYGDDAPVPVSEDSPTRPASPYGISKLAAESFLDFYGRHHGVAFTVLRFMNVYGPRQDPANSYSGVISIFLERAQARQPLTIFDDGEQTRDFIYVTDVACAIADTILTDAGDGATINVGTGVEVSINKIMRVILELTGSSSPVKYAPRRPGDIRRSVTTLTKAVENLAFVPKVDLRAGLARTLTWVRDQGQAGPQRGSAA